MSDSTPKEVLEVKSADDKKKDEELKEFLAAVNETFEEHGKCLVPVLQYTPEGVIPGLNVQALQKTDESKVDGSTDSGD